MSTQQNSSKPIITHEQAARFAPVVGFHVNENFFPCSIDWMLERSTLRNKEDGGFHRHQPKQSDLAEFSEHKYFLDIDHAAWHGQPLDGKKVTAPMYVAAQEWDDCIEITYVMLYAYQGGQTCRGLKIGQHFNAITNDYGKHQGDLEWVTVQVSKDYEKVLGVGFASHGDVAYYAPQDCLMEGTHPHVRVALNGHACINGKNKNPNDWIITYEIPAAVAVIDLITEPNATWAPHLHPAAMLHIIGLDNGQPLSDQVWARFQGRLGIDQENNFKRATEVDGSPLSSSQEAFADLIIGIGTALGKIPDSMRHGVGPEGPGARDFVNGLRRQGSRLWQFDVDNTTRDASAPPAIVAFGNQFHLLYRDGAGNGLMHAVSHDGKTWRDARQFHPDVKISAGPCGVVHENKLHVFVRDGNSGHSNGILHFVSDHADGESLQAANPPYIGLDCEGQPSAAVLGGKLCLVARASAGNGIMYALHRPGHGWVHGNTRFNTSSAPTIAAYGGRFHVFYKDGEGKGIMHIASADGVSWERAVVYHPDFTTSAAPAAVEAGHQLHLFFRDGQRGHNAVLHIVSNDGEYFHPAAPGWNTGLDCSSAPSAAVLNGKVCIAAINYAGNGIMRAVSRR
jgi:hypothetical protein